MFLIYIGVDVTQYVWLQMMLQVVEDVPILSDEVEPLAILVTNDASSC